MFYVVDNLTFLKLWFSNTILNILAKVNIIFRVNPKYSVDNSVGTKVNSDTIIKISICNLIFQP